jgi:hypothetical protein
LVGAGANRLPQMLGAEPEAPPARAGEAEPIGVAARITTTVGRFATPPDTTRAEAASTPGDYSGPAWGARPAVGGTALVR